MSLSIDRIFSLSINAALSAKDNRLITIGEGECYIGQPYSGYALRGAAADKEEIIIISLAF